ncbi:MAG: PQQ-binding-like beta-propeller repeat protein, partial [Gemmatimonadales bacterium]|nr:PQQ-binding-like beta-propeller repeat protein [Gemmatimonadales bacterium]
MSRAMSVGVAAAAAALLLLPHDICGGASGWQMFRADSQHMGASRSSPDARGELAWTFRTGAWVQSSPAVTNGSVYVGSIDGCLYALEVSTGRERWRFKTAGPVRSSPAIVEGVVYFGSNDRDLYAVDADTGEEKWRSETRGWVVSSPAVVDGAVYFGS